MIISFDLDDTLYNEHSFVKSGFKAVSKYLFQKYSIPQKESYSFLEKRFTRFGRKQILDEVLKNFNIYSKKNVLMCLSVYRKHKPKIKLYPEANQCLKRFKDFPIYIVTDGNKLVQKNKINLHIFLSIFMRLWVYKTFTFIIVIRDCKLSMTF